MGVKGLLAQVKKHCVSTVHLSQYSGRTVVVDACNILCKFLPTQNSNHKSSKLQSDNSRRVKTLVNIVLGQISLFNEYSIKLVYVFDAQKMPELCVQLEKLGVPVVIALGEADNQIASIAFHYNTCVYSSDSDMLLYGCENIILDVDRETHMCAVISCTSVLKYFTGISNIIRTNDDNSLTFSYANFVDWCVLLGTDYGEPLQCLGIEISRDELLKYFILNNMNIGTTLIACCKTMFTSRQIIAEKCKKALVTWCAARDVYLTCVQFGPTDEIIARHFI